eukprot:756211-Hanusia_phi.AAC.6
MFQLARPAGGHKLLTRETHSSSSERLSDCPPCKTLDFCARLRAWSQDASHAPDGSLCGVVPLSRKSFTCRLKAFAYQTRGPQDVESPGGGERVLLVRLNELCDVDQALSLAVSGSFVLQAASASLLHNLFPIHCQKSNVSLQENVLCCERPWPKVHRCRMDALRVRPQLCASMFCSQLPSGAEKHESSACLIPQLTAHPETV